MKQLLTLLLGIALSSTYAQSTYDYFVKADFSGSFLKAFGQTLSNEEITTYDIKNWAVPGIEMGKVITPKFQVSLSFTPSFKVHIEEQWGLGNGPSDADLSLDYKTPLIISFNGRFYPFTKGLYGAASLQYLSSARYAMRLVPQESSLAIGNGEYASAVIGNWDYKSALTAAISLGWTFSFARRLIVDVGIQVPIIPGPFHENIVLALENGQAIENADREFAERRIEDETFYYPVQFRIQLGYRF